MPMNAGHILSYEIRNAEEEAEKLTEAELRATMVVSKKLETMTQTEGWKIMEADFKRNMEIDQRLCTEPDNKILTEPILTLKAQIRYNIFGDILKSVERILTLGKTAQEQLESLNKRTFP